MPVSSCVADVRVYGVVCCCPAQLVGCVTGVGIAFLRVVNDRRRQWLVVCFCEVPSGKERCTGPSSRPDLLGLP